LKKRNGTQNEENKQNGAITIVNNNAPQTIVAKPIMGIHNYQDQFVKLDSQNQKNPFSSVKIGDKDLIDEENLLSNDPTYTQLAKDESCSTKPKACKNCSCGRKELEEQIVEDVKAVEKKLENNEIKSSCGSCYLGDAFRCATCPYKGLPAFKAGDRIKLDLSKDSNALNEKKDEGKVVITGGKVKLEF